MNAEALARRFEGCALTAYRDLAGIWTVGFGHTGKDVYEGLVWTAEQAEDALLHDLKCAGALLYVYSPNTDSLPGATDALTDFVFNLGVGSYRTSTLRQYVNAENWAAAKAELLKWDHSGGRVIEGLRLRRAAEAALIGVV